MFEKETVSARIARRCFQRAYQLQQRGAVADAIALYQESLTHFPTAEAHTYLGWAYAMLKRYEAAIEECERAIELDPDFGNPYNDIGAYLIELNRWEEALPWLERAQRAPRYVNPEFACFNAGRVHDHFGRWPEAVEAYRMALALNPLYALAREAYRAMLSKLN
jgi:tetratricopeptide (TPR) repeat protein